MHSDNITYTAEPTLTVGPETAGDYTAFLRQYSIPFFHEDPYLYAGQPAAKHGWILHLSIIAAQISQALHVVLPILRQERVPFKLVANVDAAKAVLSCQFGYHQLGKVLAIYPGSAEQAVKLALHLIDSTQAFKGPDILTDRHLGSVVYVRYGAHQPVMRQGETGVQECYYEDHSGSIVKDVYAIPFYPPTNIRWPFKFVSSIAPNTPTVLRDRYRTIRILKEDPRGNVFKALRVRKWGMVQSCVLKEGKKNMFADDFGRDIGDRLEWQFEVQSDLQGIIRVPKPYQVFKEGSSFFFAMEYIKCPSLSHVTNTLYNSQHWSQLGRVQHLELIDHALRLIDLVARLHAQGYIHRDINPDNVLVDDDEMLLIDYELVYSLKRQFPNPPFRYGTPTFISPEQHEAKTPTFKEDIYAVGANLLVVFTGQMPNKFCTTNPNVLSSQIGFFVNRPSLVNMIVRCFDPCPAARPDLSEIRTELLHFRQSLVNAVAVRKPLPPAPQLADLTDTIRDAIKGLAAEPLLVEGGLWASPAAHDEISSPFQNDAAAVYPGFFSGLSGICYVLALAHTAGISVRPSVPAYNRSMDYILNYLMTHRDLSPALFTGTSGMMLALMEGRMAALSDIHVSLVHELGDKSSRQDSGSFGLVKGISGIGLVLLRSSLFNEPVKPLLDSYVEAIVRAQERDGSWLITTDDGKSRLKMTGLDHGVAGICCFLCAYATKYTDEKALVAADKALHYLKKAAVTRNGQIQWRRHNKTKDTNLSLLSGTAGITLALVNGYTLFQNQTWKQLAEAALGAFPSHVVARDLTLGSGLVGLGEVYLDAYQAFGNPEWKSRADWIANLVLHQHQQGADGNIYWLPTHFPIPYSDLVFGNAGIIHFLLRNLPDSKLGNPLLPCRMHGNESMDAVIRKDNN